MSSPSLASRILPFSKVCAWALALFFLIAAARLTAQIPSYDHVVVVQLENHGYSELANTQTNLFGYANLPFINDFLRTNGANFTQSYSLQHPSQPNYYWLFSGSNQGIASDGTNPAGAYATPNLYTELQSNNATFSSFVDGYPGSAYLTNGQVVTPGNIGADTNGTNILTYVQRHVAANGFSNVTNTPQFPAITNFAAFNALTNTPGGFSNLPSVAFITPALENDMHDYESNTTSTSDIPSSPYWIFTNYITNNNSIVTNYTYSHEVSNTTNSLIALTNSDAWLAANLTAYAQWARSHNSLLILTTDEDSTADWKTPLTNNPTNNQVNYNGSSPVALTAPTAPFSSTGTNPNGTAQSGPNQITTIFYGAWINPGNYAETNGPNGTNGITTVNVLRTIESIFGIANGVGAQSPAVTNIGNLPVTDVFSTPVYYTSPYTIAFDSQVTNNAARWIGWTNDINARLAAVSNNATPSPASWYSANYGPNGSYGPTDPLLLGVSSGASQYSNQLGYDRGSADYTNTAPLNQTPSGVDQQSWERQRILAVAASLIGTVYQHLHIPYFDPSQVLPTNNFNWIPVTTNTTVNTSVSRTDYANPYLYSYGIPTNGIDCTDFSALVYNVAIGLQMHSGTGNQVVFSQGNFATSSNFPVSTNVLADGSTYVSSTNQFVLSPNYGTTNPVNQPGQLAGVISNLLPGDLLYITGDPGTNISHVVMWLGTNGVLASSLGYDPSTPLVISSHDNTPAIFSTTNLDPTTGLPIPTNGQTQWQAIQANLPPPGVHILPFISGNWFYENFVLAMRVIPYVAGAPLTVSNNYVVGDTNYGVTNQYLGLNFMGASTLTVPTGITLILTNGIGSSATNVVVNNSSTFQINGTANVANLFVATDSFLNVGVGGVLNTSLLTLSNTSPVVISGIINAATSMIVNGAPITINGTGVLNTPLLVISNGGMVVAAGNGIIGNDSSSSNNSVLVTGINSIWTNSGELTIGVDGSGNNLTISNGGVVSIADSNDNIGTVIGLNTGSSNNSVLVTGSNSLLTNAHDMIIGNDGSGNSLTISNGATVWVGLINNGTVIGFNGDSSNNSVLVTGSNSTWFNMQLIVGDNGTGNSASGNSLVISNGGMVSVSGPEYIGLAYSIGNSVLVTGQGSLWTNSGSLTIGNSSSSSNSLLISNGGMVKVGGDGIIGNDSSSSSNSVLVSGVGSSWTISGNLTVGYKGSGNSLMISNGGKVFNVTSYVSFTTNAANNTVLVTGTNSSWISTGDLFVGYAGNSNHLVISAGGFVSDVNGYDDFVSRNDAFNSVLVTGNGSTWSNSGNLTFGYQGHDNALVISNGGIVTVGATILIGDQAVASNNSILVTGSGSLLTNAGTLYVGNSGSANSLTISNGATVYAADNGISYVGNGTNSSNNFILITGSGSMLNNNGDLMVGYSGAGNRLIISNGGTMYTTYNGIIGLSFIGLEATSTNNSVLITGAGSAWTNTASLVLGNSGGGALTVANGGLLTSSGITIASGTGSSGTLNIGTLGGNDTAGKISSPTIAFGLGSGVINFNQSDAAVLTSSISGNGSLNQLGAGVSILSGSNSYSGTTTISAGTLQAASSNALGTSAVNLGGGSQSANLALGTNLSIASLNWGSNGVVALTPGSQILSVTGAMTNAGGGGLSFVNATLNNATNVLLNFGSQSGFTANSFSVVGGGVQGYSFLLTSSNLSAYIAPTANLSISTNIVISSTLQVGSLTLNNGGSASVNGGGTLNSSAGITVNAGGNLSDSGTINTLSVTVNGGSASVNSGGTLNSSGGVTVNAGGSLSDSGTVTTPNFTVNGGSASIQTGGTLNSSNGVSISTGTLTNRGVINTPLLTVQQGSFSLIEGTLNGSLSIGQGGSFFIDPAVVNGNVTNSGSMVVLGTNFINGNLVLTGSSSLQINASSLLSMSGSATLGGSLIFTNALAFGTKTTILTASGISGSFSSIVAATGERGRLFIQGNNVNILTAPASYTQLAANQNQTNVATALNIFIPAVSGDQLVVSTALDSLTAGQYSQAFNAIMPTIYQSLSTTAFNLANAQNQELIQRLWGLRVAGTGFSMSGFAENTPVIEGKSDGKNVLDARKDILRPGADTHWGMFVDGNGIFATANSANMLPNYNSQSGGVTTGFTYKWNDHFGTGIYAGYEGSYTKYNGGSQIIDNSVRFGLFGTCGQKNARGEAVGFYADALAGGGYNNYQVTRNISFPGLNRTATSSPGAGELDTMLATGYDLRNGNWTYGPTTSLQYTYFGANAVNETGAQSLSFASGGWNTSSMIYSLGGHVAYSYQANPNLLLVPQISLSWQHEFLQNPYSINGSLGGSSPSFANTSSTPLRDSLYTGVGVTLEYKRRWNTSLFYNASAGNANLTSQNIFWSAGVKF